MARRKMGRLMPLTSEDRARRQDRRLRLNPEREERKRMAAQRDRFAGIGMADSVHPRRRLPSDWFPRAARMLRG